MKKLPEIFVKNKLICNKKNNQKLATLLIPNSLAEKIMECGIYIRLAQKKNISSKEIKFFLNNSFFCKNRLCPFCNFLKSRKKARAMLSHKESIKGVFLHLTFTVVDIDISKQKETVKRMQHAFHLLKRHNYWKKNVIGFIRALETTRGNMENGNFLQSHPHYHFLVQVRPSYFVGKNYVRQSKWLQAWRDCYKDQNITQLSVQRANKHKELWKNVFEIIKYELKPDCFSQKKGETKASLQYWLLTYYEQMRRLRQYSTSGTLKKILTLPKGENKYLDKEAEGWILQKYFNYNWNIKEQTYKLSSVENPQETLKMQEKLFYDNPELSKKFTSFKEYETHKKENFDYAMSMQRIINAFQYFKR